MDKLITTHELLADLSVRIRIAAYGAIEASNHLMVHGYPEHARAMDEVTGRLGECADMTRNIATLHDTPGATE